jgi:hypothetical protein
LGVKRLGREAGNSPPSSAEVKECVELYLHSPNTPSWRGARLKHRDNFTLPYLLRRYTTVRKKDDRKIVGLVHKETWVTYGKEFSEELLTRIFDHRVWFVCTSETKFCLDFITFVLGFFKAFTHILTPTQFQKVIVYFKI